MSPFRRLLGYAVPYRRDFIAGLGCVVVTTAVALRLPGELRPMLQEIKKTLRAKRYARVE